MLTACAARVFWCLLRPQALGVGDVTTTTTTTPPKNTYEYYATVQTCTFSVLLALFSGALLYVVIAPVHQFVCLPFYTKCCRSSESQQKFWERKVALYNEKQEMFDTCRKLSEEARNDKDIVPECRCCKVHVIATQPDANPAADGQETAGAKFPVGTKVKMLSNETAVKARVR